jgi:hypothetical protein
MANLDCRLEKDFMKDLEHDMFTKFGICYTTKDKKDMVVQLTTSSWWCNSDIMFQYYFSKV